jgi:hypothetical protein
MKPTKSTCPLGCETFADADSRCASCNAERSLTPPTLTLFYVVRVNRDNADTHAALTREAATALAAPDDYDRLDWCTRHARDAGAARLVDVDDRAGRIAWQNVRRA